MRKAILLLCLAVAGCKAAAETAPAERPSAYVRVIDGDTIVVRGERVRIENIDAPEMPPHAKCWAEAALAIHALRAMQGYINEAPRIALSRHGKDRYGRTLAHLYIHGADVGDAMVGMGVASRWTGRRWDWCGSADFSDPNGPSFLASPAGSDEFMDWQAQLLDERTADAESDAHLSPARH